MVSLSSCLIRCCCTAGSHYGRSHPWRGHEENTWQARPPRIPSMARSWGKNLTGKAAYDKGPSRLASASTLPCILPLFLLFLFALLQILVLPAESSPAPLSLNKDQLKTLINKDQLKTWMLVPYAGARDEGNASIQTLLLAFWLVW